ncbi:MAG: PmoA family protein [Planctomycetota bacterium]|nr:PmoA family protein [Planctomycetota bacterium]
MRGLLCLAVIVLACGQWAGAALTLTTHDGVQVSDYAHGKQLLFEYRVGGVPFKPYVKQFISPAGVNVLRDAPHDHLHHHALMFAIAADGVDFWPETPGCGKQVHRSFDKEGEPVAERLDWVSPKDEKVLAEYRAITLHRDGKLGASLLTWRTTLEPAAAKAEVKLTGSHYFGLGVRFVESMDKDGKWIYPEKKSDPVVVRGDERLIRATWCAYTAKADGYDRTVAMFDDPDNTRHPATWFTMTQPFSYISATLNLWKEPMTLKAGEKLKLRYGVAVWDGEVDAKTIDALYQKWVQMVDRTKKE